MNHTDGRRFDTGLLGAALLGAVTFFFFIGPTVLNPTNVRWLLIGDTAQNYLGWQFFRRTPLLQWPLGSNPDFGVGFASSIVFNDLIPGLALLFKPLSPLLPREFQYFGWWILTCFVFQAVFAWKLASLWLTRVAARYLVVGFLLIQPAWLHRMTFEGYGHLALSGHFLLLWALLLALQPQWSRWQWWGVLAASLSVTLYLFIMVGIVYAFALLRHALRTSDRRNAVGHGVIAVVIAGVQAWAFGMFMAGDTTDSGLGRYRATLASPVDAFDGLGTSWSRILPDVTSTPGSNEGFAFIGIGVLMLVVIGAAYVGVRRQWVVSRIIRTHWHLSVALGLLALLSLSPRIGIAGRELVRYPVPDGLLPIFSSLRSSGRLMWLPVYVLTVVAIARVVRIRTLGMWVALFALLLQITDALNAFRETRERFTDTNVTLVTDNPRWNEWTKGKKHLVSIPPLNNDPLWIDLATLADRHRLTTNAAYVSRTDIRRFEQLVEVTQKNLESFTFEPDTLYVITNYPPNPMSVTLRQRYNDPMLALFPVEVSIGNDVLVVLTR
jgi:hypothetical protein